MLKAGLQGNRASRGLLVYWHLESHSSRGYRVFPEGLQYKELKFNQKRFRRFTVRDQLFSSKPPSLEELRDSLFAIKSDADVFMCRKASTTSLAVVIGVYRHSLKDADRKSTEAKSFVVYSALQLAQCSDPSSYDNWYVVYQFKITHAFDTSLTSTYVPSLMQAKCRYIILETRQVATTEVCDSGFDICRIDAALCSAAFRETDRKWIDREHMAGQRQYKVLKWHSVAKPEAGRNPGISRCT